MKNFKKIKYFIPLLIIVFLVSFIYFKEYKMNHNKDINNSKNYIEKKVKINDEKKDINKNDSIELVKDEIVKNNDNDKKHNNKKSNKHEKNDLDNNKKDNKNEKNDEKKKDNKREKNDEKKKDNKKDEKKVTENNNNVSSLSPDPVVSPSTPPVKTMSQINRELRDSIQYKYGVKVLYGAETWGYYPKNAVTQPLDNDEEINNYLKIFDGTLSKYPNGFFKEFRDNGMPLTFYLIKSVQNNAFSGFADSQFMNNIKITLVCGLLMEFTTNHEIMHAIDSYLEIKMYPNRPYDEYTAFNPEGYSYLSFNNSYNWNYENNYAYFASNYGQTNPREDRAELFKFMMRTYVGSNFFQTNNPLNNKAKVISRQIDTYFNSVNGHAYWDRLIK